MPVAASRHLLAIVLMVTAAVATGCSLQNPLDTGDRADGEAIVIGSQGSAQSEILAQVYGQVLEENGYAVTYDRAIGTRGEYLEALSTGGLDLVTDASGDLLRALAPGASAASTPEVIAALPSVLEPLQLTALTATKTDSSLAFVVTAPFSALGKVTAIDGLVPIASGLKFGADPGFEAAPQGRAGLQASYGISSETFVELTTETELVAALLGNEVQVAVLSASSPAIQQNGLVVLDDPKNLFPAEDIVPIVNSGLTAPEIASIIKSVSTMLTDEALRALNTAYAAPGQPSARDVAHAWLLASGLIAPEVTPTPSATPAP